jgi:hypothetical protein
VRPFNPFHPLAPYSIKIRILILSLSTLILHHTKTKTQNKQHTLNRQHYHSKGKGKIHPRIGHERPEGEYRYSSTLSLTSALDGVGGQRQAPAVLLPGKTQYPLHRRLGGLQGRSGQVRKISPPPGFDPRTVQPVVSRYTDYAIPSHTLSQHHTKTSNKQDLTWYWESFELPC